MSERKGLLKYFTKPHTSPKTGKPNASPTGSRERTFIDLKRVKYSDVFDAQTVPTNGNCFFAALAHQLQRPLSETRLIREEVVDFIRTHETYLVRL